jgi:hypothetical protein
MDAVNEARAKKMLGTRGRALETNLLEAFLGVGVVASIVGAVVVYRSRRGLANQYRAAASNSDYLDVGNEAMGQGAYVFPEDGRVVLELGSSEYAAL